MKKTELLRSTGSVANPKLGAREMVCLRHQSATGETEEPCYERHLPNNVVLRQPSDLSLADHVHRLDTLRAAASKERNP